MPKFNDIGSWTGQTYEDIGVRYWPGVGPSIRDAAFMAKPGTTDDWVISESLVASGFLWSGPARDWVGAGTVQPPVVPPIVVPPPVVPPIVVPPPIQPPVTIAPGPVPIAPPLPGVGMTISAVLKLAGWLVTIPGFIAWVESLAKGSVTTWDKLPPWLKAILAAVGVAVGTSLIHDLAEKLTGGGGGDAPAGFVAAWKAGDVQFYRNNTTGQLGVFNKKGRWKQWKPKKPIVLYAGGSPNIKMMFRAEKALQKDARAMKRLIDRHLGGTTKRAPREKAIPMSEAVRLIEAASNK